VEIRRIVADTTTVTDEEEAALLPPFIPGVMPDRRRGPRRKQIGPNGLTDEENRQEERRKLRPGLSGLLGALVSDEDGAELPEGD